VCLPARVGIRRRGVVKEGESRACIASLLEGLRIQRENRLYAMTYDECERVSQGIQANFSIEISGHVE